MAAKSSSSAEVRLGGLRPEPLGQHSACGMSFAHNWQDQGRSGYGSRAARSSLRELKGIGIRWISITPFGYMRNLRSVEVRGVHQMKAGENDGRIRRTAQDARKLGLSLMLKPHIWVGGGKWRAEIAPEPRLGGWKQWFGSYETFVLSYASLAEQIGARWFVVGVELKSALPINAHRWLALIRRVRRRFSGKLTYAANWDNVSNVPFWSDLDAVGVQMFAPLRKAGQPLTAAVLAGNAAGWLARYQKTARKYGKPLLLTEAGLVNRKDGSLNPHVWPDNLRAMPSTQQGNREQLLGYQALIKTFGRAREVRAIYWWKWFSNVKTDEEGPVGYSPRKKPAESYLRRVCHGA